MACLTKAEILAADDLPTERVPVPEWGGNGSYVCIRTMTGTERDRFEQAFVGRGGVAGVENIRARLLAETLVNDDGERLFEPGDIAALGAKSSQVLDRLFGVASRANGLTAQDVDDLGNDSSATSYADSVSD